MSEILPERWYNSRPDLPVAVPMLRKMGGGGGRLTRSLLAQMLTTERWVRIPEEVRAAYRTWRPTPLRRAHRLEAALGTPARIYYKHEGASPTGTFKLNTAVAQAYYYREDAASGLVTVSNDGHWGAALAHACRDSGLDLTVYMTRDAFEQQTAHRTLIEAYGASVDGAADDVEAALDRAFGVVNDSNGRTHMAHGSMVDPVLVHNSVIGLEAEAQLQLEGETPDVVFAPVSSGVSFGGLALPLMRRVFAGEAQTRFVAVESAACPSMTRGEYVFEHVDRKGRSPELKMYSVGRHYEPPAGHRAGLVFPGLSPLVSALVAGGHVEPQAVKQTDAFAAGLRFARAEGILPTPEAAHAIHAAIEEAERCRERDEARVILVGLNGQAQLDLGGYRAFLDGTLDDPTPSDAEIRGWLPDDLDAAR
ncbi:MAG: pyridoxal-phosphate dependent enzyme [Myxococcales bacterium]|nr:pyridoxal-phosphate dependent enzyme [Myxococcales bacterium]